MAAGSGRVAPVETAAPPAARLSRSTLALLVSNVGSAALSFLLSALIGRALGKSGLGVYAAAMAWVFPLSLAAEFGLGTLMTRAIAQDAASAPAYLRAAAAVRLWLGGGLALLLVIAAPVLSGDPAVVRGLQISAPLIVILPFFGAFTAIFRARQIMWPIAWLNVGMLAAQVVLTTLVFLAGGDVIAALAVNTATSAGQLATAWWAFRRRFSVNDPGRSYGKAEARRRDSTLVSAFVASWRFDLFPVLRRAWPFALAALMAALQTRISVILLERLTDSGNVGYYAAATRFVEAGRMIPNALFGALFPALAGLAADPQTMGRLFSRATLGLAGFGFVLGILFTPLAAPVMQLTYGTGFADAAVVLQIAMWSLLPGLLRAARTLYWYALGRERLVNIVTGISLIIQVALSVWLIPQGGAPGAALANLTVEVVALLLLWRRGKAPAPDA